MTFEHFGRLALAFVAPLLLAGCLLVPSKFISTLTINKDHSFAFTYKGEVMAIDMGEGLAKGLKSDEAPEEEGASTTADRPKPEKSSQTLNADDERKHKAIAEALSKEVGYKSAVYLGKGRYAIDYAVSGKLTHHFIYPYNSDAEIVLPFVMVEVRNGNSVRLRAPGFANSSNSRSKSGMGGVPGGDGDFAKYLDGEFTLDTDAEIVSQNNEEGARKEKGRSIIVWKATPLTKDAPSAVLRFAN